MKTEITNNYNSYKANHAFSQLRTVRFADSDKKSETTSPVSRDDQLTISQEGNDRLEIMADKTEAYLNTITKEDFMDIIMQFQNEHQNKLEIDPYRKVDPDGSIARKTYFESYLGQLKDMENTIKDYYSNAYNEAVSAPINSLTFISGKYLCDWSDYFDSSIPDKERKWTHHQLWAMLTDSHVALNDPYALASSGGTKTVDQMDKIAQQAVKDKLDSLIKELEESTGN